MAPFNQFCFFLGSKKVIFETRKNELNIVYDDTLYFL